MPCDARRGLWSEDETASHDSLEADLLVQRIDRTPPGALDPGGVCAGYRAGRASTAEELPGVCAPAAIPVETEPRY